MDARHLLPLWGLALLGLAACADLTEPYATGSSNSANTSATKTPPQTPTPTPAPGAKPAAQRSISASHILIAYKGATRAKPGITRTKAQAKQLAAQIDARAKKGEDFAALARKYSDGPSGVRGGALGSFTRDGMVKPFADAAFDLKPGAISGVVETPFGFHIIKRTR